MGLILVGAWRQLRADSWRLPVVGEVSCGAGVAITVGSMILGAIGLSQPDIAPSTVVPSAVPMDPQEANMLLARSQEQRQIRRVAKECGSPLVIGNAVHDYKQEGFYGTKNAEGDFTMDELRVRQARKGGYADGGRDGRPAMKGPSAWTLRSREQAST
jgi:hypothetical protein